MVREQSAKLRCSGSNPLAASIMPEWRNLVDARDLKSLGGNSRAGSIPASGTNFLIKSPLSLLKSKNAIHLTWFCIALFYKGLIFFMPAKPIRFSFFLLDGKTGLEYPQTSWAFGSFCKTTYIISIAQYV